MTIKTVQRRDFSFLLKWLTGLLNGYPSLASILLCQVSDRYRVRYPLYFPITMHCREQEEGCWCFCSHNGMILEWSDQMWCNIHSDRLLILQPHIKANQKAVGAAQTAACRRINNRGFLCVWVCMCVCVDGYSKLSYLTLFFCPKQL